MSYKDIRFFYLSLQLINNNNVWPNRFFKKRLPAKKLES